MRGAVVDRRLEAIAGAPSLYVSTPTRNALARTVVVVGICSPSAQYLLDLRADGGPGYAWRSSPPTITAGAPVIGGPAGSRADGEIGWAYAILGVSRDANIGGSRFWDQRWAGPIRGVTYSRELTTAEVQAVIRWCARTL